MGIEGACSNAYFDAPCACVPADVTFNRRSRRPPRDLPNAAPSDGYAILLSEYVSALHTAGLEPSIGIAPRPPTSSTAWRWTSWNSSSHSWLTGPSWRSCARSNSGPNTASSSTRSGECSGEPTARKSLSTPTRSPASDPSPVPSRMRGVVVRAHRSLGADASVRRHRTRLPVERGRLAMICIIAYNIADNKRWLRVAKMLESWGYRIQESVFQLPSIPPRRRACTRPGPPSFPTPKTSFTSTPSVHPAPTVPTCSERS